MNVILINDLLDSLLVHVVMVDSHVVLVTSSPVRHGAETKDIVGQCHRPWLYGGKHSSLKAAIR